MGMRHLPVVGGTHYNRETAIRMLLLLHPTRKTHSMYRHDDHVERSPTPISMLLSLKLEVLAAAAGLFPVHQIEWWGSDDR